MVRLLCPKGVLCFSSLLSPLSIAGPATPTKCPPSPPKLRRGVQDVLMKSQLADRTTATDFQRANHDEDGSFWERVLSDGDMMSFPKNEEKCLNVEVNFSFGGSQTNDGHRDLNCLGGVLFPCEIVDTRNTLLANAGVILPGQEQQIDFARSSLTDVEPDQDLFLLIGGVNDFYGPWPGWDPTQIPPEYGEPVPPEFEPVLPLTAAWSVNNVAAALEAIRQEFGPRFIIAANVLDPCSTLVCDKLAYVDEAIPGFSSAVKVYSKVWVNQFDRGIRIAVDQFKSRHSDTTVVFVDFYSKITELLDSGDYVTDKSCRDALLEGNKNVTGPDDRGYYDCGGYAWTDDLHLTSTVLQRMVEEAFLPAVYGSIPSEQRTKFRRMIAFGDSLTDLGSYKATVQSANEEWGASLYPPPSNGRAGQNGLGVVEYLEKALGLFPSAPFLQQPRTIEANTRAAKTHLNEQISQNGRPCIAG